MKNHYQVLIVGGGTAGLTVASQLATKANPPEMGIIEPSDKHYYQPLWTMVGGGVVTREETERNEADFIPAGTDWIQDTAASFDPDNNTVTTGNGDTISYDYLVVAAGIQIDWHLIPGLKESVGKAGTGVCSNYSYATVNSTWDNISNFKGGTAIFTQPATPIKCAGAPQKIMYLAADHFKRSGVSSKSNVLFRSAGPGIFGVKKYADTLYDVIDRYGIDAQFKHDLTSLDPDNKVATFKNMADDSEVTINYDMIHVTPPMSSPDFIKNSPLAAESGWVSVDSETLQHTKYDNVFSLGDCSSLPTSKTGAAIRKQAPTLVANLMSAMSGQNLSVSYTGYTSCPLVTGYGSLVLAEFGYDKQPMESFPFDQGQERYSMYAMKVYGLPRLYWHGMLRGRV